MIGLYRSIKDFEEPVGVGTIQLSYMPAMKK